MSALQLNNRSQIWLSIDIANQMGYDKKQFQDRVKWVNENLDILESFQDKAESPWEFANSCSALRNEIKGIPSDNMVYLDASNQALKLYAVLRIVLPYFLLTDFLKYELFQILYLLPLYEKYNDFLEIFHLTYQLNNKVYEVL